MNPESRQSETAAHTGPAHEADGPMLETLRSIWQQSSAMKQKADALAHSAQIPPELAQALHNAAERYLNEKVYDCLARQQEATAASASQDNARKQSNSTTANPQPRQMYRVEHDRMIAGVCGGVAEFFHMDSGLVRVLTVVCTLLSFPFIAFMIVPIGYVAAAILLPVKSEIETHNT